MMGGEGVMGGGYGKCVGLALSTAGEGGSAAAECRGTSSPPSSPMQYVGARRAAAALAPPPSLRRHWARPAALPVSTRGLAIDHLMAESREATLLYRGARVGGGSSAWFHGLSVDVSRGGGVLGSHTCHRSPPPLPSCRPQMRCFAVPRRRGPPSYLRCTSCRARCRRRCRRKVCLPSLASAERPRPRFPPFLPACAERAFTAAVRAQEAAMTPVEKAFTARSVLLAPGEAPPPPPEASGGGGMMDELLAHLDAEYAAATAAHPGLAVLLYSPRAGMSAVHAAEFGLEAPLLPALVVCAAADSAAAAALGAVVTVAAGGPDSQVGTLFSGLISAVLLDGTDVEASPRVVAAAWAAASSFAGKRRR